MSNTMKELDDYYIKKQINAACPGKIFAARTLNDFVECFPNTGQKLIQALDIELTELKEKDRIMGNDGRIDRDALQAGVPGPLTASQDHLVPTKESLLNRLRALEGAVVSLQDSHIEIAKHIREIHAFIGMK